VSDNAAVGAEQDIFGLFGDKKDVHYQVSKTRRDLAVKTSIKGGSLARVDCNIAPSAELLELREKAARCDASNVLLRVCVMVKHEGEHYLQVPQTSSLPFIVPEDLECRLQEVADDFGVPSCRGRSPSSYLRSPFPLADLPLGYEKVDSQAITVGGETMTVWSLRRNSSMHEASGSSAGGWQSGKIPEQMFVLHNSAAARITLPARSLFCGSSTGRFFDRTKEDVPPTASSILWPWSLKLGS